MSMTDPIADMLTRIRNAAKAKKRVAEIPCSNIKREIAALMHELGFIRDYKVVKDNKQNVLLVYMKYTKRDESVIVGMRRVSRPGLRKYLTVDDIKKLGYSIGTTVISTSQGVMSHEQALKNHMGGEALFRVW